jgi:hypothetical protein
MHGGGDWSQIRLNKKPLPLSIYSHYPVQYLKICCICAEFTYRPLNSNLGLANKKFLAKKSLVDESHVWQGLGCS